MGNREVVDGLVSIIMPSWNTERFIAETIQSVINQTYTNWELLIVDDCSSDNTDEIVASFKDDRIKYFHNKKFKKRSNLILKIQIQKNKFLYTTKKKLDIKEKKLHKNNKKTK